jgi:hypothetical protein
MQKTTSKDWAKKQRTEKIIEASCKRSQRTKGPYFGSAFQYFLQIDKPTTFFVCWMRCSLKFKTIWKNIVLKKKLH